MGSCVSSHHNSSTMKVHVSSGSNRKPDTHALIVPSPVKEKLPIVNGDGGVKPPWHFLHSTADCSHIGMTDETFFDSQAWLDSDCESDFMSANGEFTPSRGNTPVHHHFFSGPLQTKGGAPAIDDHKPYTSPFQSSPIMVKKKKRLSELFSESQRESRECDEDNNENGAAGSLEAARVHDGGGLKPKRERWVEIVQVHKCLPRVQTEVRRK